MGEGTGEDDDDQSDRNVNGAVNPNYGSTSQVPRVAFVDKSNMNNGTFTPLGSQGKSPPPPYGNGASGKVKGGQSNGGFENSVETVVPLEAMQKQSYISKT